MNMLTARVKKMKEKYFDTIPQITAERLVLQTEAYKKYAGDAVPIFRAKVVQSYHGKYDDADNG